MAHERPRLIPRGGGVSSFPKQREAPMQCTGASLSC